MAFQVLAGRRSGRLAERRIGASSKHGPLEPSRFRSLQEANERLATLSKMA